MNNDSPTLHSSTQFLEAPIASTIVKQTLHMILGIIAVLLFNIIDTFYIGQLGATELAAISFTFPVTYFVVSIALGLGIGAGSVIARVIGTGDLQKAQRLTTDSLLLAVAMVTCVSVIGFFSIDFIFLSIGAPEHFLPLIREYMSIWYAGVGFVVIPMVGNSAIRATGDARTPSQIMIIAAVVNAALDPLLIFGIGPFPRMELEGAAIATVIAYMITFVAALWFLGKRERLLTLKIPAPSELLQSWKQIAYVGLPAAGNNMLIPLSSAVLTRLVATHGVTAVAAFGVGVRLESILVVGIMALSSILTPFIAQNWGADQCDRARQAIRFSFQFSLVWGISAYGLCSLFAYPIAGLFTEDEAVIQMIARFIWVIGISYGIYGLGVLGNSVYNAFQLPAKATLLVVIRFFILIIPCAYVGSHFWGIEGLFAGIAVGYFSSGTVAYFLIRQLVNRES